MGEVLEALGIAIVVVVVGVGLLIGIGNFIAEHSCYGRWERSRIEAHYGFWEGCQVKPAGAEWMPDEQYIRIQGVR